MLNKPTGTDILEVCKCLAEKNEADIKQMSIKDENGTYTSEFVHLLKDYYLYL